MLNLHRRVHDLVVYGESIANLRRREARVVGDHAQRARETVLAHSPHVEVGHACFARVAAFDRFADLRDDGVFHFPVEQHVAGASNEPPRPDRHERGADEAHDRVEPRPTPQEPARQRHDREHGRGRVGHDMDVGGA